MTRTLIPALASLFVLVSSGLAADKKPVELGQVAWLRDYAAARKLARKQDKPILILFDEVPG